MSTPPTSGPTQHTSTTGTSKVGDSESSLDKAKEAGRELKDKAVETAQAAAQSAADQVRAKAEGAKDSVADEVSSFGNSLRTASRDMREGSPQEQAFGYMADALADISDHVRGKDLTQLMGELSSFGRRNPVAFLGGAALLGFAGMRLARASARDRYPYPGNHDNQPAHPGAPVGATPAAAGGYRGTASPQPAASTTPASNPSSPSASPVKSPSTGSLKND